MTADLPGLALDRLHTYLGRHRPELVPQPPEAILIEGGRSNLTYLVTAGPARFVLRRPPLGHVLASAHDMTREYRAISALAGSPVPVPPALLHCTDDDVLGAPFYVMGYVEGTVIRTAADAAALEPQGARALSLRLVDILADLHRLDPHAVGLDGFGRPAGFLDRQLRRWWQQFEASRSRDIAGIEVLRDRLAARVPTSQRATIVHGDFRLDNTIVTALDVRAVLDWEMATLGDPLTDLGMLDVYWNLSTLAADNPITTAVRPGHGFATMAELAQRYADRSGLDLAAMPWYRAFSRFKLAVILEGIHFRFHRGQTVGAGFAGIGEVVAPLVRSGLDEL